MGQGDTVTVTTNVGAHPNWDKIAVVAAGGAGAIGSFAAVRSLTHDRWGLPIVAGLFGANVSMGLGIFAVLNSPVKWNGAGLAAGMVVGVAGLTGSVMSLTTAAESGMSARKAVAISAGCLGVAAAGAVLGYLSIHHARNKQMV
jgi:hypothetical protein